MNKASKNLLRTLPSISTLLETEEVADWLQGMPRTLVVAALQTAIDDARQQIIDEEVDEAFSSEEILIAAEEELTRRSLPSLQAVVNATGIVLHTGLGRAPLSEAAIEAIVEGASGYCNLEFDLETGERGKRSSHVSELLCELSGAEAATVVNNNAAATYLILRVLAEGKEVVMSRGQLIEIGGSFRLPDIFSASGAILREVGTTNRTRIGDYEKAIGEETAILMRAHPSNFRVIGFTEEASIAELADLAHERELIALDDLGSGALVDAKVPGLPDEPSVADSINDGADVVCFSGDKLLGGPQCGIIVGREELIAQINSHPLMRTYRVDKLTLLALEATLRQCFDPADAVESIPTLSMLRRSTEELGRAAHALAEKLRTTVVGEEFLVCTDVGFAGGGAMPEHQLETVVVQWRPNEVSVSEAAAALREAEVPIVARVRDEAVCFDVRTLREDDFDAIVDGVFGISIGDEEDDEEETDGVSLPVVE